MRYASATSGTISAEVRNAACGSVLLAYITTNTERSLKKTLTEINQLLENRQKLETRNIFALAYGVSNFNVHEGAAPALGSKNNREKRTRYTVLNDSLRLHTLAVAGGLSKKKLMQYER